MLDIDRVLNGLSYDVFSHLEDGERLIIKTLAKEGPLSATEIGKFSSRYTRGFNRWGVKKRLVGTSKFMGLIPTDYVFGVSLNEKETKLGLNLKGFLAALSDVKFEKVYVIRELESYLHRNELKDQKLARWGMELIKYEITLILYFIKIQGLDWTKFRQTRLYIRDLKNQSEYLLRPFYANVKSLKEQERKEFQQIKNEYLRLVIIIHLITELDDRLLGFPLDNYGNYKDLDEVGKCKFKALERIYHWYNEIQSIQVDLFRNLGVVKKIELWEEFEYIPERQPLDPVEQFYEQQPLINEIIRMLEKEGYHIRKRNDRQFS